MDLKGHFIAYQPPLINYTLILFYAFLWFLESNDHEPPSRGKLHEFNG